MTRTYTIYMYISVLKTIVRYSTRRSEGTRKHLLTSHSRRLRENLIVRRLAMFMPRTSSENRVYLLALQIYNMSPRSLSSDVVDSR